MTSAVALAAAGTAAFVTAIVVGWLAVRRHVGVATVVAAASEVVLVGVVVARLSWVVTEQLGLVMRSPLTVLHVHTGLDAWLGIGAAIAWGVWRWDNERLGFMTIAAPPAALAATAAWLAVCGGVGECPGVDAVWALDPVGDVPIAYLEAGVAALLAVAAFVLRERFDRALLAVGVYALVHTAVGILRTPLEIPPSRHQLLSALAAVAFVLAGLVLRSRRVKRASRSEQPS